MTVIETFTAYPIAIPCSIAAVIGAFIIVISALLLYYDQADYVTFKATCIVIGTMFMIFGAMLASLWTEERHQIIIDENTSIIEIQSQYEIIGQKGISYIVKDVKRDQTNDK